MDGSCRLGAVMTVPLVEACACCCADNGSSLSKRDTARRSTTQVLADQTANLPRTASIQPAIIQSYIE